MGHVSVVYRKRDDHISGFVVSENMENESEIIRILDEFLFRWCGKHCFAEHGMPMFFGIPSSLRGRNLTCRLPAAFRRAGFKVFLKHAR